MWFKVGKKFCCISLSSLQFSNFPSVLLFTVWITYLACIPDKPVCNLRAQSKNDPLIFRPFLKMSTCQNSTTSEHFQKWPKNQGIILALSPPIVYMSYTLIVVCPLSIKSVGVWRSTEIDQSFFLHKTVPVV